MCRELVIKLIRKKRGLYALRYSIEAEREALDAEFLFLSDEERQHLAPRVSAIEIREAETEDKLRRAHIYGLHHTKGSQPEICLECFIEASLTSPLESRESSLGNSIKEYCCKKFMWLSRRELFRGSFMSFKVTRTQHVLAVDDFEASVAYFIEKLGFTEYNRVDGWSFLRLGDFWLMVGDCRGEVPARDTGNHSWFAYVNCEGIDDLYQQYIARQVPIKESIADKPWGLREFLVETPEGHRIKFGQTLR